MLQVGAATGEEHGKTLAEIHLFEHEHEHPVYKSNGFQPNTTFIVK
jgi:hypothetical protein